MPTRLIAILPMLLLAAALIATACESATPDAASQNSAVAAAAPTSTPSPTQTPTQIAATQTPTATPDPLNPPTPQPCPPGEIPVPVTVRDGIVYIPNPPCIRLPSPTPTPRYQKLDSGLNRIVEALAQGISAQQAAGMAALSKGERVEVDIYLDRDPRELVTWLVDNDVDVGGANGTWLVKEGEWPVQNEPIDESFGAILLSGYISGEAKLEPAYEGGETVIWAEVPVSLLVSLSQRPGVLRVDEYFSTPLSPQQSDVPPAPQEPHEPVTSTPTPRATSQALSAHGATSWHQAGYKGSGVKIGIIDTGFQGFRNLKGSDLPATTRNDFASSLLTT